MAQIGLDIVSCSSCNPVSFNMDGNSVFSLKVGSEGMTAPQIAASYMDVGEEHIPCGFLGGSTNLYVTWLTSHIFPTSEVRQIDIEYADLTKVIYVEVEGVNVSDPTLDLTCFPNLHAINIDARTGSENTVVENIILPQTIGTRTINEANVTYYPGCYLRLQYYENLSNINIPSWEEDGNTAGLYYLIVTGTIQFNSWKGSRINIYNTQCNVLDMSDIHFTNSDNVMETEGWNSTMRILNSTISTINLPSNIDCQGVDDFFLWVDTCPNITYIDFSPMQANCFGNTTSRFDITIENGNLTAAQINRMLVEMDNIAVTHDASYEPWITLTGNTAPDSSSGGYDGVAAMNSLESKGYDVILT